MLGYICDHAWVILRLREREREQVVNEGGEVKSREDRNRSREGEQSLNASLIL